MTTKRETATADFESRVEESRPGKWLVPAFALEGRPTFLWGSRHTAKSYLATYLAMCVAVGKNFLTVPTRKANVLYADLESGEDAFHRRCLEISRGMGIGAIEDGRLVGVDGLCYGKARAPLRITVSELAEQIAEEDIGLIIIDSLYASGRAKGKLPEYAMELRNLPCPTMVIHHIDKRIFNEHHQSYYMQCGSAWYVEARLGQFKEQEHREPSMLLKLQHERHSFSAKQDDMYLRLRWDEAALAPSEYRLSIDKVTAETFHSGQPLDIPELRILEYVRSVGRPCSTQELADALDFGVVQTRRVTRSLVGKGRLDRVNIRDGAGPGRPTLGWDLAARDHEEH